VNDPRRVLQLLERALEAEPATRAALLDSECDGDAQLRSEVERLLKADAVAGAFLDAPLRTGADRSGERVGPWQLIRELGHGGMGSVYLATRADDLYAKQVALKLLRFDVADLRARFANERRILATLEHPNVARLLDAGTDASGAPYVAMEYVEGEPITRWCDAHALDLRARIALFVKVLDAVQSAHSQLIVHRDLKPANILVDRHGEPKLLDFGIAKLVDRDERGLTLTGMAPLTPEYASPEQVRGAPIGTASDIYALGVLLYELVTRERPYDIASTNPREIERAVCESVPPRPSAVARAHGRARVDRDLDHTILRALAKAPAERYASCTQFADDLRRYLAGQPVLATHARWSYRAWKFIGRHRLPVAVSALFVAMLLAGTLIALQQARIARAERDKAQRVNAFLHDMLAAPDPALSGRHVTVADVLDHATASLDDARNVGPEEVASLRLTLADTYLGLGLLDPALVQARAAVALVEQAGDTDAATRARAYQALSEILHARSEDDEALRWSVRVAAFTDPAAVNSVAEAENMQGIIARTRGDYDAAAAHYERSLDVYRRSGAPPDSQVAVVLNGLGVLRGNQGDFKAAIALHEQALAIERRLHPQAHPQVASVLAALGDVRALDKDFVGSEAAFKEALAMRESLLGMDHADTISTLAGYANMLAVDLHRYAEGEVLARRAWDAARAHLPDPHQQTAYAGVVLSECLVRQGRAGEAVPILRVVLAMRRQMMAANHPLLANTESLLGAALVQSGSIDEGEPLLRGAVARLEAALGADHELTQRARARLLAFEATRPHAPPPH
jgi:serine/threonine-protein kinase